MTNELSRRSFLKYGAALAAMMGLPSSAIVEIAEALDNMAAKQAPVLWLQGLSCSGCSVSMLNSVRPTPAEILTGYINLRFHSTISTATGEKCSEIIERTVGEGGFVLVAEGAVAAGMPKACVMHHRPMAEIMSAAAAKATAVVAIGSCSAVGGIPAAENNPTGAMSTSAYLTSQGIATPVVNLPGCPCHPDWLVGTLVHVLKFGLPALDNMGRPTMFYSRILHEQCPRFADYEREKFAKNFSDPGCLFRLGCLGPITKADCTTRYWNGGVNTCIAAGAPCIGCASPEFARKQSLPFYRKNESFEAPLDARKEDKKI